MVDRSYSKFPEIRDYRDRGMKKWQGFFISEHNTAMKQDKLKVNPDEFIQAEEDEIMLLLNQAFLNELQIKLVIRKSDDDIEIFIGKVIEVTMNRIIYFKTSEMQKISIDKIISIEEVD
ncbi:hypothetical protein BG262_02955 [Floricoccus penangensis]|uniref:YolD-like family protein n=1 Tax=Floricoccus penangensis TaxID=1859475 RepID=A0A9Q5JGM5_9LACT|nr:hypothetical protein [Floricoccus penangensis]OFI46773.1 hypothetical protein BG262_02955 [Floricoccus penangensis]